jgi:hypothetical protein
MSRILAGIVEAARLEAATATSWTDFSDFLFDPQEGLLTRLIPTGARRRQFMQSAEYAELTKLRDEVRDRTGLFEGSMPPRSNKILVELPQSMRAALEAEAQSEGVSVDQLVIAKLAMPMPNPCMRPTA